MEEQRNKIWSKENSHKPLVSIVVVTYNAAAHLEQCFQSILQTSFRDYELLVFDGNSTDGTLALLEKYKQYIHYWQSEPDKGIYDAMNKALQHIRGQWIYFLGADDVLLPGFSELANELKYPNSLYYGYCIRAGKQTNMQLTAYEVAKINVCHQAVFYPADVVKKWKYNTDFAVYADHALNIQCWGNAGMQKKYFPYAVAKFNDTGFSSFAKDAVFEAEKPAWIKKYMSGYIYIRYLFRKWKAAKKGETDFR